MAACRPPLVSHAVSPFSCHFTVLLIISAVPYSVPYVVIPWDGPPPCRANLFFFFFFFSYACISHATCKGWVSVGFKMFDFPFFLGHLGTGGLDSFFF